MIERSNNRDLTGVRTIGTAEITNPKTVSNNKSFSSHNTMVKASQAEGTMMGQVSGTHATRSNA